MQLVPTAVSNAVSRQALLAGKASPKILFATGVVGMIGSTVFACRATLKMDEVVEGTKNDLAVAKSLRIRDEIVHQKQTPKTPGFPDDPVVYEESDYRHDVAIIYARAIRDTTKLYAPALILGAAAIGCLAKSHDILSKRNAALTAAYVAVDEAFDQYRKRVVDKYGDEQDREFRYGVEEVDIIDENGKLHKEKRPEDLPSMYARFFDEYSTSWSKDPEYNYVFLSCQQKYANDMLTKRGHLFLNEVYDMLGLDRTTAGSVVGWVITQSDGDNYVDFGIFKGRGVANTAEDVELRDFINGRNASLLLDFNVDGIIYDKIDNAKERIKWQS